MRHGLTRAFTMIELIFVIIILGILAATALPKFVGIQDDAKISAEKGTVGAVRGGIALSHSKWLLNGTTTYDWDNDGDGGNTFSTQGYLVDLDDGDAYDNTAATTNGIFAEILSEPAEDWVRTTNGDNDHTSTYEGPASGSNGVPDTAENTELNTSGQWTYDASTGRFTYGEQPNLK